MLGLFAFNEIAWQGALLQMVNHGLSTGALFLLVGMLYDRRHTKKFEEFGGLAKSIPWFAVMLVFSTLASVGLPALNGFVGEFMILMGAWQGGLRWATGIATFGVVLAAVYLLKMLQETIWGPITKDENRTLKDLSLREVVTLLPLCVLMLWIGVAPGRFLEPSRPALASVLATYRAQMAAGPPAAVTLAAPPAPSGVSAPAATFVAGTPAAGAGSAR
jgi:NADH-quinone oxidoreductase subunit M